MRVDCNLIWNSSVERCSEKPLDLFSCSHEMKWGCAGPSSQYCYSVNDGSRIDFDRRVVLVLWGGPGLLSVHVPISFHTPPFCLLPHCLLSTRSPLRVLTNDSTDFDYHSEVSLVSLLPVSACFWASLQSPLELSQLVIKLCCEGTNIRRFRDEKRLWGRTPQSLFIWSCRICFPSFDANLLILSSSVACWSGGGNLVDLQRFGLYMQLFAGKKEMYFIFHFLGEAVEYVPHLLVILSSALFICRELFIWVV